MPPYYNKRKFIESQNRASFHNEPKTTGEKILIFLEVINDAKVKKA